METDDQKISLARQYGFTLLEPNKFEKANGEMCGVWLEDGVWNLFSEDCGLLKAKSLEDAFKFLVQPASIQGGMASLAHLEAERRAMGDDHIKKQALDKLNPVEKRLLGLV